MVLSGHLIKFPYWVYWQVLRLTGRLQKLVLYVDSLHDYYVIENILPHLEETYKIAARNKNVAGQLEQLGIEADVWPAFPSVLMMTRHAFHRFPIKAIKKIGIKHGTYHFKKMIHPKKYNAFDLYIFVTEEEAKMALEYGINCGVVGGQPKLDTFFREDTRKQGEAIKTAPGFDPEKQTLLFTTTWDRSGLSAADRWIDHLPELKVKYNVFVSLHPMMSSRYFQTVKSQEGITFVGSDELPAFMLAADILVSDTSSVMGEFCALDKPVITFRVETGLRLTPQVKQMIADISLQIDTLEELDAAVQSYLSDPDLKRTQRMKWQKVFYGDIHQSHGKKTAAIINDFVRKQSL